MDYCGWAISVQQNTVHRPASLLVTLLSHYDIFVLFLMKKETN